MARDWMFLAKALRTTVILAVSSLFFKKFKIYRKRYQNDSKQVRS